MKVKTITQDVLDVYKKARERDPAILERAEDLHWPRGVTPDHQEFRLNMVRMQVYLIQQYLKLGMIIADIPRAHRTLDALHLKKRALERLTYGSRR